MSTELLFTALAWLGTYLVHSTLLLGTVALLARKRMLSQPRLVERMWKVAALGGILTATAQVSLVTSPVLGSLSLRSIVAGETAGLEPAGSESPAAPERSSSLPETGRRAARPVLMPGPAVAPTVSVPTGSARQAGPREQRRATTRSPQPAIASTTPYARRPEPAPVTVTTPAAATTEVSPAKRPLPWKPAVVATWAVVGGWGLLGFLFAWSRLFARLSDRRVLKSGLIVDRLAELCRRAGVKRRIRLTASSSIDSPITHGWFRREICVPERALIELSAGQLESTLAHELAHVLRRDPL